MRGTFEVPRTLISDTHLALTHLVPTVTAKAQVRAFFEEPVAQHYAGQLTVGDDGTRIVIELDK